MSFSRILPLVSLCVLLEAVDIPSNPFFAQQCLENIQCNRHIELTGELILKNRPPNKSDCEGLSSIALFSPDEVSINRLNHMIFYGGDRIKVDIQGDKDLFKELSNKLPEWYKEGLMGEIQFYVKGDFYDFMPASRACNGGWIYEIKAANIEIIEKTNESLSDKKEYGQVFGDTHFTYERLILDSSLKAVTLHEVPKGKVLAHIQPFAQNHGLLYRLDGQYNNHWGTQKYPISFNNMKPSKKSTQGWAKIIFFPPNETSAQKAIVGYILESSIKGSVMSLDLVEENALIIPTPQFQVLKRPPEVKQNQYFPTRPAPTIEMPRVIRTPY